jgi:hypothetical protein
MAAQSSKANLFTPSGSLQGGKKGPSIRSVLSSYVTVPVLPDNTSSEDRQKFLLGLAATGSSISTSLSEWKSYVAAYTYALFPSLLKDHPKDAIRPATLTVEQITRYRTKYDNIMADPLYAEDSPTYPSEVEFRASAVMPGLPLLPEGFRMRCAIWENDYKVIASHYAIVLFLAGKRIEGEDHSSITQKRPDALKRKAHLEGEFFLLEGEYRISDIGHLMINSAWAELSTLRIQCIRAYSSFESEGTDEVQDIIYTTMHLLKHSNMVHAKIANSFIATYPWIHEIPALKPSLQAFVESVAAAEKFDVVIRPYVKLMYGDKANIFPRKEMEPLVACAVAAAKETSPTMTGFFVSDDYTAIVDSFLEERDRRSNIRELTIKKEEGQLMDWAEEMTPDNITEDAE